MESFNWTCPHCQRHVTITDDRCSQQSHVLRHQDTGVLLLLETKFLICPNPDCRETTLTAALRKGRFPREDGDPGYEPTRILHSWQLVPPSNAKSFPDYIPEQIRTDYEEACLIRDLSPKASATVARRCLQGIIRNFWGVQPTTLAKEIQAIEDKVEAEVWAAIDAVRTVGNIGAHMEKDINVIVDVEPHEAELLIQLIEDLLEQWYIAQYSRKRKLEAIKAMAHQKQQQRKGEPPVADVPELKEASGQNVEP